MIDYFQEAESGSHRLLVLGIILVFSVGFILNGSAVAQSEEERTLTGSWENDLFFHPDPGPEEEEINYDTSLDLSYNLNSFTLGSLTRLRNTGEDTGLTDQSFDLDGRLGIFDLSSDLVFDTEDQRLDYWLNEASFTFAGATLESVFLLEFYTHPPYVEYPAEYGAGLELAISGDLPGEGSAEVRNLFGMKKNKAQMLGIEKGSGYDIATKGPGDTEIERRFFYGGSSLHYVSTTAEFFDLSFGCCSFDNETKFSREDGFEYTEFDFSIDHEDFPLTFDTTLRFTSQTKSVSLDPYIEVSGDCFKTYLDLGMTDYTIEELEIEGFGLSDIQIGNVTFSNITAVSGDIYRTRGSRDLTMRADDYVINPTTPDLYTETPYDEIASISYSPEDTSKYPNHSFGADLYFDMDGDGEYFDLSRFTADLTTRLSSELELGTGASITPEGDVEALLEIDISF